MDTIDIIGYILIGGAMLVAALRLQDQDDNDGDNSDDGPGGGMMIPVGGAA